MKIVATASTIPVAEATNAGTPRSPRDQDGAGREGQRSAAPATSAAGRALFWLASVATTTVQARRIAANAAAGHDEPARGVRRAPLERRRSSAA